MKTNIDALTQKMLKANDPSNKISAKETKKSEEQDPTSVTQIEEIVDPKAKEELIKKYTQDDQETSGEEDTVLKKDPITIEENQLDAKEDEEKSDAQKEIEALNLTIDALMEKLNAQGDETSPEAIFLLEEINKAKEKRAEKEVELSVKEQEKEAEEIDDEELARELSKKMLQEEEEKKKERKTTSKQAIETEPEIDVTQTALLELQNNLKQRGINSVITGTGNNAYLKTDAQGALSTIDPKQLDISKIDTLLQTTSQQQAPENGGKEEEIDEKAALLEKYTQNHHHHDPRIEATINHEIGSHERPLPPKEEH